MEPRWSCRKKHKVWRHEAHPAPSWLVKSGLCVSCSPRTVDFQYVTPKRVLCAVSGTLYARGSMHRLISDWIAVIRPLTLMRYVRMHSCRCLNCMPTCLRIRTRSTTVNASHCHVTTVSQPPMYMVVCNCFSSSCNYVLSITQFTAYGGAFVWCYAVICLTACSRSVFSTNNASSLTVWSLSSATRCCKTCWHSADAWRLVQRTVEPFANRRNLHCSWAYYR